jgi:hypothetical protein
MGQRTTARENVGTRCDEDAQGCSGTGTAALHDKCIDYLTLSAMHAFYQTQKAEKVVVEGKREDETMQAFKARLRQETRKVCE